jgi:hypothetical protein
MHLLARPACASAFGNIGYLVVSFRGECHCATQQEWNHVECGRSSISGCGFGMYKTQLLNAGWMTPGLEQVYTVVLVLVTQQLTIRGIFLKHQTLTATHDEMRAWAGLGAALTVLWKQTQIAASVFGTLLTVIYLIGISILHISTPSLLNFQAFPRPNRTMVLTQKAMPQIKVDYPVYDSY